MPPPPERLHALDCLRAFAMFLGIVLHGVLSFADPPVPFWPVRDPAAGPAANVFLLAVHGFRMQVFFLLAGFFGGLLSTATARPGCSGTASGGSPSRSPWPCCWSSRRCKPSGWSATPGRRRRPGCRRATRTQSDAGRRGRPLPVRPVRLLLRPGAPLVPLLPRPLLPGRWSSTGGRRAGGCSAGMPVQAVDRFAGRTDPPAGGGAGVGRPDGPAALADGDVDPDTPGGWVPPGRVLGYYFAFFRSAGLLYRHRAGLPGFAGRWRLMLVPANAAGPAGAARGGGRRDGGRRPGGGTGNRPG